MLGRDLRRAVVATALLCTARCFQGYGAVLALRSRREPHAISAACCTMSASDSDQEGGRCATHRVRFKGREVSVKDGETLRTAMLRSGMITPHNGQAQLINCRGLGTCGTCAVEVKGDVLPSSWNRQESLRLNFPPHAAPGNLRLRLACQVRVKGDLEVTKFDKFWGQGTSETKDQSFSAPFGELEFLLDNSHKDQ